MQCINCQQYRILTNETKETYGFCSKKQIEKLPFDKCTLNYKEQVEQRAIKIYLDNYKTKNLDEIVSMISSRSVDKEKLNYIITKHFLPRRKAEKN